LKMAVEIIIPAFLQPFTGGINRADTGGKTLGGCLDELVEQFPALYEKIYVGKNKLHKGINVFINSERAEPKELNRPVNDGDRIHIAYVTVGG
jgi:molybdopterin converting factor small subunit